MYRTLVAIPPTLRSGSAADSYLNIFAFVLRRSRLIYSYTANINGRVHRSCVTSMMPSIACVHWDFPGPYEYKSLSISHVFTSSLEVTGYWIVRVPFPSRTSVTG